MSVVDIVVADVDIDDATYTVNFKVSDSLIDEGQVTAACFTAYYVQSLITTHEFRAAARRYGENLLSALNEKGPRLNTTKPAIFTVCLEDMDVEKGSYRNYVTSEGGDPTGESLPTPAQIVGAYINTLLYDMNFRKNCWDFAADFVRKRDGADLTNRGESPITLNLNNDEAATLAA